jgi:hypothetical protein
MLEVPIKLAGPRARRCRCPTKPAVFREKGQHAYLLLERWSFWGHASQCILLFLK